MLPPCATSVGGTDDQEHWAKGYHSHFPRNVNDLRPIPAAVRDYERHAPALPTRQIGSFAAPEEAVPWASELGWRKRVPAHRSGHSRVALSSSNLGEDQAVTAIGSQ